MEAAGCLTPFGEDHAMDRVTDRDGEAESDPNGNDLEVDGTNTNSREQSENIRSAEGTALNDFDRARNSQVEQAVRHFQETKLDKSYADQTRGILGCSHYRRMCKSFANCCGVYVPCRICHDEAMHGDHQMNRFTVSQVLCMVCGREQPVGPRCTNDECTVNRFAQYYCDICHLYDDSGESVYHCERCGICRRGRREENFHCDRCNACIAIGSRAIHVCLETSMQGDCPFCMESMFESRDGVVFLRCGHAMHGKCFEAYAQQKFTCPICWKSVTDMSAYFRSLDALVETERETMAPEFRHRSQRILCHDCGGMSNVPFHFQYHKCPNVLGSGEVCGSYNTRLA